MNAFGRNLLILIGLFTTSAWAQSRVHGRFLADSIEVGRPFQYALTYWHSPKVDVLFPDTGTCFRPYRVQKVDVYATQTTGNEARAVSRDSAVYTLVSFETDSTQLLGVPVRVLNDLDCTAQWTQTDTVFLRSRLPSARPGSSQPPVLTLVAETNLAPLQQQFNYMVLAAGLLSMSVAVALLYGLFGRTIRRQWRLYLLNRRHLRFLQNYNQLSRHINSFTAAETANQVVVMWKLYLQQLERRAYMSLTTPELAERINDRRVTDALREADRMIYGGTFSDQSQSAFYVLRDVATQAYHRSRSQLQGSIYQVAENVPQPDSTETSSFS